MGERSEAPAAASRSTFLAFYDSALPHVYGYLFSRCGQTAVAEDLTAETFLAAADAFRAGGGGALGTGWAMAVARHKLADHWRRSAREQRRFRALADLSTPSLEPWDAYLDSVRVQEVLVALAPQHRAALTLRYVDDLGVAEVASLLGRTVHATEALLVRARAAFRRSYEAGEASDD